MHDFLVGLFAVSGFVAIIATVAAGVLLIYGIRRLVYALKGEPYKPLLGSGKSSDYEHQDVSEGSTADSVASVFRRYHRVDVVGKYAHSGLTALESCQTKTENFKSVLDNKFESSSLSWSKFSVAADSVEDAILRNCALLANRIQVFDYEDYRRTERLFKPTIYRKDQPPADATQEQKLRLFNNSLSEMDTILASNERLLLELDKLTSALGTLNDINFNSESDRLVEEIRTLTEETKYYRQGLQQLQG
ncbi:MAG: hypothetical protein IJH04_05640 [Eggerthellaceae bacterium]|nr:hypothetical protein [Eggerthellaceae bacterium]